MGRCRCRGAVLRRPRRVGRMKDGSNVRVVMMHHVNFLPPDDGDCDGGGGGGGVGARGASSLTRCGAISIPFRRACSPHAASPRLGMCPYGLVHAQLQAFQ